jgi:hypothetical protein
MRTQSTFSHLLEEQVGVTFCPWRKRHVSDQLSRMSHSQVDVQLVDQEAVVCLVELGDELFHDGGTRVTKLDY